MTINIWKKGFYVQVYAPRYKASIGDSSETVE